MSPSLALTGRLEISRRKVCVDDIVAMLGRITLTALLVGTTLRMGMAQCTQCSSFYSSFMKVHVDHISATTSSTVIW